MASLLTPEDSGLECRGPRLHRDHRIGTNLCAAPIARQEEARCAADRLERGVHLPSHAKLPTGAVAIAPAARRVTRGTETERQPLRRNRRGLRLLRRGQGRCYRRWRAPQPQSRQGSSRGSARLRRFLTQARVEAREQRAWRRSAPARSKSCREPDGWPRRESGRSRTLRGPRGEQVDGRQARGSLVRKDRSPIPAGAETGDAE